MHPCIPQCETLNPPADSTLVAMATKKTRIPAQDVIREDSGPPITQVDAPDKPVEIDVDDALIEDPKDHVFQESRKRKIPV